MSRKRCFLKIWKTKCLLPSCTMYTFPFSSAGDREKRWLFKYGETEPTQDDSVKKHNRIEDSAWLDSLDDRPLLPLVDNEKVLAAADVALTEANTEVRQLQSIKKNEGFLAIVAKWINALFDPNTTERARRDLNNMRSSSNIPVDNVSTPARSTTSDSYFGATAEHDKRAADDMKSYTDAQGGDAFLEGQATISNRAIEDYGPSRLKALKKESRDGNVAAGQMLERIKNTAKRQPEDLEYKLAESESVLRWQENKDAKNEYAADIKDTSIGSYDINLEKYPYRIITIELPKDDSLPYDGGGVINFKPYLFDGYERWPDAVRAKEAGVRIIMDHYPDGRPRGVHVEFTKAGLYTVGGTMVAVGVDAAAQKKAMLNTMNQKDIKQTQPLPETMHDWGKMRFLHIRNEDGETMKIDLKNVKEGQTYIGKNGVSVTRDSNGRVSINYREKGVFAVLGRWGGERYHNFQNTIVK